ncbi:MAG: NAD(P)(+) transhydrogenase (Re/Si-specific) subunit beta [Gemmatimonadetes bacterium]|nr:NAD(P)(+) transhydrogenase (Re/Si-specific) subunit beta [Gemmatimonadota bacterium]
MPAVAMLFYLLSSVLFILGLKRLGSPATAPSGNRLAALGMLLAIVTTLVYGEILSWGFIIAGVVVGSGIGAVLAKTVQMTAMPQMVALLNGFGGGASALVAAAEFLRGSAAGENILPNVSVSIQLSVIIGAVTFSGSLVAFGKLQGLVTSRAITYPLQKILNGALLLAVLVLAGWIVAGEARIDAFTAVVALALILGVLSVISIGGADMPVVISLLNSYSGLAAAMTGFVIGNHGLIIAGALVGASGIILTTIMCRAMNRSLANVLFGAFGAAAAGGGRIAGVAGAVGDRTVRQISLDDAAVMLAYAKRVIIVPGYGLAVAQAQHDVREMADLIERKGGVVKYAIHPVAGRMPGHMNVLLAEANIPYPKLKDMDEINPEFERADVSLVIGANDVVNPAARDQADSPLYGMPILDVDKSHHVIVLKRSMNPGFAGVDNDLFYNENTSMLFGDAKDTVGNIVQAIKEL